MIVRNMAAVKALCNFEYCYLCLALQPNAHVPPHIPRAWDRVCIGHYLISHKTDPIEYCGSDPLDYLECIANLTIITRFNSCFYLLFFFFVPPLLFFLFIRRHTPYGNQTDYRIFELNKRLQNWTEVSEAQIQDAIPPEQPWLILGFGLYFLEPF